MSVLALKADIDRRFWNVRFVPIADIIGFGPKWLSRDANIGNGPKRLTVLGCYAVFDPVSLAPNVADGSNWQVTARPPESQNLILSIVVSVTLAPKVGPFANCHVANCSL